jgi:hypothetical protein
MLRLTLHRGIGTLRNTMHASSRSNTRGIYSAGGFAFSSLLLLHALLIGPLLVECFPAGGGILMELLGHDPCHSAATHTARQEFSNVSVLISSESDDPCVDIALDNPGVTNSSAALPATPGSIFSETTAGAALYGFRPIQPRNILKPARAPGMFTGCRVTTDLSLRI